ncbi:hypothetical protein FALCPG4_001113 [Fusarium falciforme]
MFAMTQPRNPRNSFHKQQVWFGLRMTRTLDPGQSPIPSYILVRIPMAQSSLTTGSFHVKADVNGGQTTLDHPQVERATTGFPVPVSLGESLHPCQEEKLAFRICGLGIPDKISDPRPHVKVKKFSA